MIKTAVILGAGLGSRLKDKTKEIPKGFISVGGKTLIDRSITSLLKHGITKIIIGTGHAANVYEEFAGKYPQLECVKNEQYSQTGSMYTLYNLRKSISADFLLLESDLLYDGQGLQMLIESPESDIILASGQTHSNDEVFIEADADGNLVNMSKNPAKLGSIYAELVGITKIAYPTFLKMCAYAAEQFPNHPKLDYEYVLVGVGHTTKILVKKVENFVWCEIDDENHLKRAEEFILPKLKESESNVEN